MRSRPRSPVLRTSGSRGTAAGPTLSDMPGDCPLSLPPSRARCRSTTPARAPGGCWRSTSTRPAASGPVSQRTRSETRRKPSQGLWPASAARCSPTYRRPAAATSWSCSPLRCPGTNCATSPAPWGSRHHPAQKQRLGSRSGNGSVRYGLPGRRSVPQPVMDADAGRLGRRRRRGVRRPRVRDGRSARGTGRRRDGTWRAASGCWCRPRNW
jgi:hypothetical protein